MPELDASDARRELFHALALPAFYADRKGWRGVHYVVQPFDPPAVCIVRPATDGGQAVTLASFRLDDSIPDSLRLREAAMTLAAGLLSALPADASAAAIACAARASGEGGFLIHVNPDTGTARLLLCSPDLGDAPVLGAVVDAPATEH